MIHNILVVGCGNMGSALVRGFCRRLDLQHHRCCLYDIQPERASRLAADCGIEWVDRLSEVPFLPSVVVLAFKPDCLSEAAPRLRSWPKACFISVLAGVTLDDLQRALGGEKTVVRLMPNLAVEVGEGVVPVCFSPGLDEDDQGEILFFLSSLGWVFEATENNLDYYTALSGSGPGFISVFIEALADGGVNIGIPWETSLKLALQTVGGTASLLKEKRCHPGVLKNQVASPGGTTIAGIRCLEDGGVRAAVMKAVETAYRKIGLSRDER